jgi:hypothetical protein
MKNSKKRPVKKAPTRESAVNLPKLYSIDTPYGSLTFLEGDGDDLDPAVVKEWEREARNMREARKRAAATKTAKSNGKKKK